MKYNIYSFEGLTEAIEERKDLMNFRDRVEENGGSTTDIEERIEDISDGIARYKLEHKC